MNKRKPTVSFRCFFGDDVEVYVTDLDVYRIEWWIIAFMFVHPDCSHIEVNYVVERGVYCACD